MSELQAFLNEAIMEAVNFTRDHFWHLLIIIIMLFRKELRWIGLILGFVYIIFGDVPTWLWVVMGIFAILTEMDYAVISDLTNNNKRK